MINIAIVEDEKKEQELLASYFSKLFKESNTQYTSEFFSDAESFLKTFAYSKYDLIMMDIELPGINGMKASSVLREIDPDVVLIFMTNLAQYAIDGYKVKATDYIVKPIAYWDFEKRISTISKRIESRIKTKIVILENDKKIVVPMRDIFYIEVSGHQVIYHTLNGDYRNYTSLKELAQQLVGSGFSLCNSCFLVNLAYVESVEGYTAVVHGDKLLISHPKRKPFLNDLNKFYGEL
ncbi:MAG: LytTR family DNA-binding domain-containing protein [Bacilli bacterium]